VDSVIRKNVFAFGVVNRNSCQHMAHFERNEGPTRKVASDNGTNR
jgi:hypothetical protein